MHFCILPIATFVAHFYLFSHPHPAYLSYNYKALEIIKLLFMVALCNRADHYIFAL